MNTAERLADAGPGIAVVIPCFRVRRHVCGVLRRIGPEVRRIYVVDDACPEGSGRHVQAHSDDPRVRVLFNPVNLGVGGAVMRGYREALADGDIGVVVKIDGDGQMDPALVPRFVAPIAGGWSDYTKGNRFYRLESLSSMPRVRIIGNLGLSFLAKLSTGYWQIFDPTNGYTAIHAQVLRQLPLEKMDKGYFFETDMLFRLNTIRAVVTDIPMDASYGDERSSLNAWRALGTFFVKHCRNAAKRIFYNFYLRDLSIASIELPLGLGLFLWGCLFGGFKWWRAAASNLDASAGTAILSSTMIIVGLQLLLGFFAHDMANVPKRPLHILYGSETDRRAPHGE